jgi:hypothetical protein
MQRTLPELIETIFDRRNDGFSKTEVAGVLGIPEAVVNDVCRGRLPGQVWADKASGETVRWLAKHYPEARTAEWAVDWLEAETRRGEIKRLEENREKERWFSQPLDKRIDYMIAHGHIRRPLLLEYWRLRRDGRLDGFRLRHVDWGAELRALKKGLLELAILAGILLVAWIAGTLSHLIFG